MIFQHVYFALIKINICVFVRYCIARSREYLSSKSNSISDINNKHFTKNEKTHISQTVYIENVNSVSTRLHQTA